MKFNKQLVIIDTDKDIKKKKLSILTLFFGKIMTLLTKIIMKQKLILKTTYF